jgi:hypothetical protein
MSHVHDLPSGIRAAAYCRLRMVLFRCERITLKDDQFDRQYDREIVRPKLAALRWLARERFAEKPQLEREIDELEKAIDELVNLPLRFTDDGESPERVCPACGSRSPRLTDVDQCDHCSNCLSVVMPAFRRLESHETGFGTEGMEFQ